MTHAKAWATAKADAEARMATAPEYRSPGDVGEVWCRHCDQPAVHTVRLTSGETAVYCGRCITRISIQASVRESKYGPRVDIAIEDDPRVQHEPPTI